MGVKKQWLYQGDKPLWQKVADDYREAFGFAKIIVVGGAQEIDYMRLFGDYTIVAGGNSRQQSLINALKETESRYVLVNDVARCCIDEEMISRVVEHRLDGDCIVPVLGVHDTLYLGDEAVDRDIARLIQTPQLTKTDTLRQALSTKEEYTDESSAVRAFGGKVVFVDGSVRAHKLTRLGDLHKLPCLSSPSSVTLVGYGIDIHPFEANKEMKLCGITIDSPFGFKAHSDGDVAIHAVIDAIMGAAGLGDIGELFPDTDDAYAGADSSELLSTVVTRVNSLGFEIRHIDMTIMAQAPKILPYKARMREHMAHTIGLPMHRLNIKATTAEKLGFVGRKEGVTVHAVATLGYFDWTKGL